MTTRVSKSIPPSGPELIPVEPEHDRRAVSIDGYVSYSGPEVECRRRLALLTAPQTGRDRGDYFLHRAVAAAGSIATVLLLCVTPARAGQCHWGPVPDQSAGCTPGEAASTDEQDVCATDGGTYSQRHRLSQTPAVKRQVLERYGVAWEDRDKVEDDHDLPLCLGGADTVANRWPQPRTGTWNAGQKDKVEAEACRSVCTGKVTLTAAQGWFKAPADWRVAYCAHFDDPACSSAQ